MKKLVLAFLLLALFFLSGCADYESKYEKLQDEYDELLAKYDLIGSWYCDDPQRIGPMLDMYVEGVRSTEDPLSTLYLYFEENSVSFDEAYDAYESLSDILFQFY